MLEESQQRTWVCPAFFFNPLWFLWMYQWQVWRTEKDYYAQFSERKHNIIQIYFFFVCITNQDNFHYYLNQSHKLLHGCHVCDRLVDVVTNHSVALSTLLYNYKFGGSQFGLFHSVHKQYLIVTNWLHLTLWTGGCIKLRGKFHEEGQQDRGWMM